MHLLFSDPNGPGSGYKVLTQPALRCALQWHPCHATVSGPPEAQCSKPGRKPR